MTKFSISPLLRRRAVLGTIVALGLGIVAAGRYFATADECLVGTWRVTESSSFPKSGTLDLRRDGAALLTELQAAPYSAVWKSTPSHLEITLVSRGRPDLDEPVDPGPNWRLEWKIVERTADSLRLEGPTNGNWPSGQVKLVRQ